MGIRRSFAIISHPDAGKTTLTEQLLKHGQAKNQIGYVKSKKEVRSTTSDWLAIEQKRGISVQSSVMQFNYRGYHINLLDTPGHNDFSEDAYRTLTATDAAVIVIDGAKGIESRTKKLIKVCRSHKIPLLAFVNKIDRDCKDPCSLLDEIELELGITVVPKNWPNDSGKLFAGLLSIGGDNSSSNIGQDILDYLELFSDMKITPSDVLENKSAPLYFGSALKDIGVAELLDGIIELAPAPRVRGSTLRDVFPKESLFTGFVFKIQANSDLRHRDRIAFVRIVSGKFSQGMRIYHQRLQRYMSNVRGLSFFGSRREEVLDSEPGDIIGLHNHGNLQIGDTLTGNASEKLHFIGIPWFSPEMFKKVRAVDPMKAKHLRKALIELAEEGCIQAFFPKVGEPLLGAVGQLQFDVAIDRLKLEWKLEIALSHALFVRAEWITADSSTELQKLIDFYPDNIALDLHGDPVYLANNMANLKIMKDKFFNIRFSSSKELNAGKC